MIDDKVEVKIGTEMRVLRLVFHLLVGFGFLSVAGNPSGFHYHVCNDSCMINCLADCFANMYAKRLYDDLLSNYNRLIRPVNNNTDKLTVWLNLKLSQLIDVVTI